MVIPYTECYMQEHFYHRQQEELDAIAKKLDVAVFRPNYHAKKGDNNTVLFYTKQDEQYNRDLEAANDYVPSERYKRPFFWFENTDRNGHGDYSFANWGKIDLRPLDWKERLEGAVALALYKHLQREYAVAAGGYLGISEADDYYNDLNRKIVQAFAQLHGKAYLGNINFDEERYNLVMKEGRSVYDEYEGQKIYNASYAFIVPEEDEKLQEIIVDWNKPDRQKKMTDHVNRIMNRIEKIGGISFVWY